MEDKQLKAMADNLEQHLSMKEAKKQLQEIVNELKRYKDEACKSEEIKDEDKNIIIYKLTNSIYDSIINLFGDEVFQNKYGAIFKAVGPEAAEALVSIMTATCINTSIGSMIVCRDELMDIVEQLSSTVENCLTDTNADLSAVKDAVVVLRKRIESISNQITLNKIHI